MVSWLVGGFDQAPTAMPKRIMETGTVKNASGGHATAITAMPTMAVMIARARVALRMLIFLGSSGRGIATDGRTI